MKIAVRQTQTLQKKIICEKCYLLHHNCPKFLSESTLTFPERKNVPTFLFTYTGKFSKIQKYFLFHLKFKQNGTKMFMHPRTMGCAVLLNDTETCQRWLC